MSLLQSQFDLHVQYRWGLYGFWAAVLFVGTGVHLVQLVLFQRRTSREGDVEGDAAPPGNKHRRGLPFTYLSSISRAITTNLVVPPAFGSHHQRLLRWCYIPTRMEAMVVAAYWVLNLVLCCISFETVDPNARNSPLGVSYTPPAQLYRFIADRTGIMAFNNLPILWVFSLRNNCFMWLTGWSFSTFMTFHRHISRIVMIQVIVHASTYSAYQAAFSYLTASWKEHYWQMGAMAILSMGFIHASSSIYFRIKCYDFFLLTHIALSVVFLAGLYYHLDHFVGSYDPYIWPLVGVWVFDRVVRIVRLAYCNIALFRGRVGYNVLASYSQESSLIKLQVTTTSRFLRLEAGKHFFLYRPLKWRGWESHPFTLASWSVIGSADSSDRSDQNLGELPERAQTSINAALSADHDGLPTTSVHTSGQKDGSTSASTGISHGKKLTFYVRPRKGWTMRLRDECLNAASGSVMTTMLLEGPYGQTVPVEVFDSVVFIVGGSGITVALSYLQQHAERTRPRHADSSKGPFTRTRRITLVWVAREQTMIREITAGELQPLSRREDVRMLLFSTSRQNPLRDVEASQGHEKSADQDFHPQISLGRPNVTNEILGAINDAANVPGVRIAVVACGPAAMADEARNAVHKASKAGKEMVEYFEESFGW